MNWSEFENDMKGRVGEHQTPVDTDALWDKLQQKRRKPVLVWWWLSAAGLSVAAMLLWVSVQSIKTPDAALPETVIPTEMVQQTPTRLGQEQPLSDASTSMVQEKQAGSSKTAVSPMHGGGRETDLPAIFNANSAANPTNSKGLVPVARMQQEVAIQKLKTADYTSFVPDITVSTASITDKVNSSLTQQPLPVSVPTNNHHRSFPKINTLLVPLEIPVANMPEPQVVEDVPSAVKTPDVNTKTTTNASRMGLHLGYDRWQSTGQLPAHQADSRSLESLSLALVWSKPVAKNWSVQTGLAYARTTRLVSLERTWETQKKKATTNYFANGNTAIDSFFVQVERTRKIRHYNHWQQIGIPVSLQYRLAMGNGTLLHQLGLQANWLHAKGIGITKNNEPSAVLFDQQYGRHFLLQVHAGFEWMFPLGNRYSVSAGPRFQFDLTPRSSKNAAQAERFWQGGVQVGVSYKL